jgi:hypothetical protein
VQLLKKKLDYYREQLTKNKLSFKEIEALKIIISKLEEELEKIS